MTCCNADVSNDRGSSSSGGQPSHLASTFVDKMLRSGYLQNHIRDVLIPTYRKRCHVLMTAIHDLLYPLGVTIEINRREKGTTAVAGGFFTYLRLPRDIPTAKTVAAFALREQSLRIAFGHMFTVAGDPSSITRAETEHGFARCIRLCWAWHEEPELQEGIARLAAAIVDIRARTERGEDVGSQLAIGIR